MAKILLTGMTAPQTSPRSCERSISYARLMYSALLKRGHEVWWTDPGMHPERADYAQFDAVLLGVSPITSLSANRSYGALVTAQTLFSDNRLTLFIDAPMPSQITASLRSVLNHPDNFFKTFNSYRKDYGWARDIQRFAVLRGVEFLHNGDWPRTLYPHLPWMDVKPEFVDGLPVGAVESLIPLNLDNLMPTPTVPVLERQPVLLSDDLKSKWALQTIRGLSCSVLPMKVNKGSTDKDVMLAMAQSVGSIVAPAKDGFTWWSPRFMQSLLTGTPVATEWRQSASLDASWSVLASTIESLSDADRASLAFSQHLTYAAAIPTADEAAELLEEKIGLS